MRVLDTRIYPLGRPTAVAARERVGPRITCAGDDKFRLQPQQKPARILDRFLDPDEEGHRFLAVDDAVIIGQR